MYAARSRALTKIGRTAKKANLSLWSAQAPKTLRRTVATSAATDVASATADRRRLGKAGRGAHPIMGGVGRDPTDRLIVIGSGVAGCSTALVAAQEHKVPVTLLCAGSAPTDCNSYWAQGGIIYRNYSPDVGDSAASLASDIHFAGAGLSENDAVWKVAMEGPSRVRQLLLDADGSHGAANVPFDVTDDGSLSCCLEASHEFPRIIHYADKTGAAITSHITAAAMKHPLIEVRTDTIVTDLLTEDGVCLGVQALDKKTAATLDMYGSYGTVLANGGLAGIYEHTTNPKGFNALGSAVSLAVRAVSNSDSLNSADVVSDLEYVQFHPTALYVPNQSRFLLTEALRGEGALLRNLKGEAFAQNFHPNGELAPRDVVARGVYDELQRNPSHHNVFLDITHRPAEFLRKRFPTIDAHLRNNINLDFTKQVLPIVPAAHYTCGGVTTDLNARTSIPGLYAAGEAARTGLHGGNRLASTSLLEALVFGASAADFIGTTEQAQAETARARMLIEEKKSQNSTATANPLPTVSAEQVIKVQTASKKLLRRIQSAMWDHVGVVRSRRGLQDGVSTLEELRSEAEQLYHQSPLVLPETIAARDAAVAGYTVATFALRNTVSAGAHFVEDADEEIALYAKGDLQANVFDNYNPEVDHYRWHRIQEPPLTWSEMVAINERVLYNNDDSQDYIAASG